MACCKNNNNQCSKNVISERDYLVCTCMGVMHSDICQAIKNGSETFDQLSEQLGVGTGCSSCVSEVHDILRKQIDPQCCKR